MCNRKDDEQRYLNTEILYSFQPKINKNWKIVVFAFLLGIFSRFVINSGLSRNLLYVPSKLSMRRNYIYVVRELSGLRHSSWRKEPKFYMERYGKIKTVCQRDAYGNQCCTLTNGDMQCSSPPTHADGSENKDNSSEPSKDSPRHQDPKDSSVCTRVIMQCVFLGFGCTPYCVV